MRLRLPGDGNDGGALSAAYLGFYLPGPRGIDASTTIRFGFDGLCGSHIFMFDSPNAPGLDEICLQAITASSPHRS